MSQNQTQTHKRSRTPSEDGIPSHSHPKTSSPTKRRRNAVSDASTGTTVKRGPWDNRLRSKPRSYCTSSDSLGSEASLSWPIASPSRTSRKQFGYQAASEDSLGSVVGHFDDMSLGNNELESHDHHLRMMDQRLDLKKQVDRKAELEQKKAALETELEKTKNELKSRVEEIKAYTTDIKSISPKMGSQQRCEGIQAEMDLDSKLRTAFPDNPDAALSSPGYFENGVYRCFHEGRIIPPLKDIEDEYCLDDTSMLAASELVVPRKPIEKKMEFLENPIYVRFAGGKKGWLYEYDYMDEDLQEYESMLHPSKDAAH